MALKGSLALVLRTAESDVDLLMGPSRSGCKAMLNASAGQGLPAVASDQEALGSLEIRR